MKTNATNRKLLIVLLALVMVFCVILAACADKVTVIINLPVDTLKTGEMSAVSATGSNGETCTVTVDKTDLAVIENGILKIVGTVEADTTLTVTATLPSDPSITATKVITVKATPTVVTKTVTIASDRTTIDRNTPAKLTITATDDEEYNVSVSNKDLVYFNSALNTLVVFGSVDTNTDVTVTVTLKSDSTVTASKTFTVVPVKAAAKITISGKDRIAYGDSAIYLTVNATGGADYIITSSNNDLIKLENNYVTVLKEPAYDTTVTITAKIKDDTSIQATKKILVKAPRKDNVVTGSNGLQLTNAMIQAVGNSSITVKGTIKDVYTDYNAVEKSYETTYNTTVMMSDDKWIGSWYTGNSDNVSTDAYQKGSTTHSITTGDNEVIEQHVMERVYINKNNTVSYKTITNYQSIPVMWEEQHLWNHMSALTTDSFEFNSDEEVFSYVVDATNLDVLYFMEYLKVSFTPLMDSSDAAFGELYLIVEG
ncbi:MAG: hypothetical protein NC183_06760, partial [Corallococcus sp.]|nr:hypothetical protein [Corallococcus sp.]